MENYVISLSWLISRSTFRLGLGKLTPVTPKVSGVFADKDWSEDLL